VFVQLYTTSGAVLALLMLVAAFRREAVKALWLIFLPSSQTALMAYWRGAFGWEMRALLGLSIT
jgi:hypothetical protein